MTTTSQHIIFAKGRISLCTSSWGRHSMFHFSKPPVNKQCCLCICVTQLYKAWRFFYLYFRLHDSLQLWSILFWFLTSFFFCACTRMYNRFVSFSKSSNIRTNYYVSILLYSGHNVIYSNTNILITTIFVAIYIVHNFCSVLSTCYSKLHYISCSVHWCTVVSSVF